MDPRDDTDAPEWVLWNFWHLVSMVLVLSATAQEVGWMWMGSPVERWDGMWEEYIVEMREREGGGNELYEDLSRRFSPEGIQEEGHPGW